MGEELTPLKDKKVYEPPMAMDVSSASVNGQIGIIEATCVSGLAASPNCNNGTTADIKCHNGGMATAYVPGSTLI